MTFGYQMCGLAQFAVSGTFVYLGNDEETIKICGSVDNFGLYLVRILVLVGQIFAHNFSSPFGLTKESATGAFDKAAKTEALRVSGR